jgi:hypothetical protein
MCACVFFVRRAQRRHASSRVSDTRMLKSIMLQCVCVPVRTCRPHTYYAGYMYMTRWQQICTRASTTSEMIRLRECVEAGTLMRVPLSYPSMGVTVAAFGAQIMYANLPTVSTQAPVCVCVCVFWRILCLFLCVSVARRH